MKATIALEYIGEAYDAKLAMWHGAMNESCRGLGGLLIGNPRPRKPWVAEILGRDEKFGFSRAFLRSNWQRKRANGAHTRGVELWFVLESGRVYEVKAPVSWRTSERYFCRVTKAGDIVRVDQQEVERWLSARSASMS